MANLDNNFNTMVRIEDQQTKSTRKLLPEKTFVARNSPLTDVFSKSKVIYNLFAATLILIFAGEVLTEFVDSGRIELGFREISAGLRGLPVNLLLWSCMQICTLCVYPCFLGWIFGRLRFKKKRLLDIGCVFGLVIYQVTFVVVTIKAILMLDLSQVSSIFVLMEMIRFVMKVHAFVRSGSSAALEVTPAVPTFRQFVYFLFAPTLIYRNEYPRTQVIRWRIVLRHSMEVTVLLYMCYIFSGTSHLFKDFGTVPISTGTALRKTFQAILPANLYYVLGLFALLHSWLNAWAEVLRFSDRLFYRDSWNVTSVGSYVRSHNVLVHNFLYTYIYKDFYEHLISSKKLAALAVFLLSGAIHEVMLAVTFRFFYPVMLGQFLLMGLATAYVRLGNVLFLASLAFGNALVLCLYSMEWYARRNCPGELGAEGWSFLELMAPVSWRCGIVSSFDGNWTVIGPWS